MFDTKPTIFKCHTIPIPHNIVEREPKCWITYYTNTLALVTIQLT